MLGSVRGNFSANRSVGQTYVKFNFVAQEKLKMRPQEAGQYIDGYGQDIPGLGKDLRWLGNTHDYESLEVHHEDADRFVDRVKKHLEEAQAKEDKNTPDSKKV